MFWVRDINAVGSYTAGASPYGLLDMAGNDWEWVQGWYSRTYYVDSPVSNPAGPITGMYRVLRGGAWNYEPGNIRAASRYKNVLVDRSNKSGGIRCAF